MHTLEILDFKNLDDNDLKEILRLRNLDCIREHMAHTDIIALEDHMAFCRSLKDRKDKLCLCFKYDGQICGVINLSDIDNAQCDLGYYFVKTPFNGFKRACFIAAGGGAQALGIGLFSVYVKKSNAKGMAFARQRLKAMQTGEDEIYVYFSLSVSDYLKNNSQALCCSINKDFLIKTDIKIDLPSDCIVPDLL